MADNSCSPTLASVKDSSETNSSKQTGLAERLTGCVGLALLALTPVATSRLPYVQPLTYEHAYVKTFLFQTAGVLLFAVFLFGGFRRGGAFLNLFRSEENESLTLVHLVVAWLGWNAVSTIWAERHFLALERSLVVALMVFLAFGMGCVLGREAWRMWWMRATAVALALAAVYVCWTYSQPYDQFRPALFSNRELAAGFFYVPAAVALSFLMYRVSQKRKGRALVAPAILAVLFVVGIERTQSAAALGGLAVLAVGLLVLTKHRKRVWWIVPVLLAGIVGLSVALSGSYTIRDLQAPLEKSTFGVRLGFWESTWKLFIDFPFSGVGAGGFVSAIADYRSSDSFGHALAAPALHHAHCFALETLAELGPVGLVIFVLLAFKALRYSWRSGMMVLKDTRPPSRRNDPTEPLLARGIFAGMLAMLAHSFVGVGFAYPEVQSIFWLSLGLVMGMRTDSEPEPTGEIGSAPLATLVLGLVLVIGCWWIGSLNPLRAQAALSRGIGLQRAAKDEERPTAERFKDTILAEESLRRALSVTFPGRARIPATLHLASTLDYRASFLTANDEQKRKDWRTAMNLQMQFLRDYPGYGLMLRNIAQLGLKLGDHIQSIAAARAQADRNPWDLPSYQLWMQAARQSGDRSSLYDALKILHRALENEPESVELHYLRATLLLELGQTSPALEGISKVEELCRRGLEIRSDKPTTIRYRLYLARVLMEDHPDEAREHCYKILKIRPNHQAALQILRRLNPPDF